MLITTHYHGDHVSGLPELAAQVEIREIIDHGPKVQPGPQIDPLLACYAELSARARHRVVKPDDTVAMPGVVWRIVSAGGLVWRNDRAAPVIAKSDTLMSSTRPLKIWTR